LKHQHPHLRFWNTSIHTWGFETSASTLEVVKPQHPVKQGPAVRYRLSCL
jgi:hypothetical protein